eukprot:6515865-Prymnesium_polylepis.1
MSGHICLNSGLRVVLTRFNSRLRAVLTQGVLTACHRENSNPAAGMNRAKPIGEIGWAVGDAQCLESV